MLLSNDSTTFVLCFRKRRTELASAEMSAELLFQRGDDACGEVGQLGFGQGGFAALESYADQQRVLPRGGVLAAVEVEGIDRSVFANVGRTDCVGAIGERRAIGEEHGKIALDGGEARDRLISARFFRGADRGVQRRKLQLGEEGFLAQVSLLCYGAGELARFAGLFI